MRKEHRRAGLFLKYFPFIGLPVSVGSFLLARRTAQRLREKCSDLEKKLEVRTTELREALDRQTATADVLKVISGSPTDTQPMLDAIAVSATRFAGAEDAA